MKEKENMQQVVLDIEKLKEMQDLRDLVDALFVVSFVRTLDEGSQAAFKAEAAKELENILEEAYHKTMKLGEKYKLNSSDQIIILLDALFSCATALVSDHPEAIEIIRRNRDTIDAKLSSIFDDPTQKMYR
jgi:hypothetical protein